MPNYPTAEYSVRAGYRFADAKTVTNAAGDVPLHRALICNNSDLFLKVTGEDGTQAVIYCQRGTIYDVSTSNILTSTDGSSYASANSLSVGDITLIG